MPQEVKMTPEIVAALVGAFRELRVWSQETLAELARVNVRTLQRVESKQPGSADTLRALARAFDLSDIDYFLKSHSVDTAEEIAAEKQRFEKDYVEISVECPASSRSLAAAVHGVDASALHVFGNPPAEVETAFASLVDYLRDYGDCADLHSEVQRVDVFRDLDKLLTQVAAHRFAVAVGYQEAILAAPGAKNRSVPWRVVYFACHPVDRPMETMFVPRRVTL